MPGGILGILAREKFFHYFGGIKRTKWLFQRGKSLLLTRMYLTPLEEENGRDSGMAFAMTIPIPVLT